MDMTFPGHWYQSVWRHWKKVHPKIMPCCASHLCRISKIYMHLRGTSFRSTTGLSNHNTKDPKTSSLLCINNTVRNFYCQTSNWPAGRRGGWWDSSSAVITLCSKGKAQVWGMWAPWPFVSISRWWIELQQGIVVIWCCFGIPIRCSIAFANLK